MNSILVLVVGIGILIAGYVFYGKWLAGQWGVDPKRKTPAFTEEDGVDYVPAKAPVLMGHHFSSIAGVAAIVVCVVVGLNFHPIYLSETVWMVIVGIYITVASVAPVWILLQPRDYLSSFLLYFMMIVAAVGVIGSALMGHASLDIPAFIGFKDTLAPTGSSLGFMFPALFVTIACGAISGFHSLVGSGTTSKQLDNEKNARPIAYGGMLIECALAIVSLCAVGYIWSRYADGTTVVPTAVFATGISEMVATIPGLGGSTHVLYSLLVLTVSVFCLTSLDTATRLARYMF